MDLTRTLERFAATTARAAWPLVKLYNEKFERESIKPNWAPAALLKRRERTFPPLGWPRTTDSLCPKCVKETRQAILDGACDLAVLVQGKPGEIPAEIVEEAGQIVMKKTCDKHGTFTDVLAIDPAWLASMKHGSHIMLQRLVRSTVRTDPRPYWMVEVPWSRSGVDGDLKSRPG